MSGTEWAVVIGGVGAIAWVNWYFFLAQRPTRGTTQHATTSSTVVAPARQDAPAAE